LKPERWGSLLVQEKYQEEKACDKRHPYRIIIIIIIIIKAASYCNFTFFFSQSVQERRRDHVKQHTSVCAGMFVSDLLYTTKIGCDKG
jgi:flagellar basal body-associated protein FliL